MPVLIYVDHADNHIKKSSFEALTYGVDLASAMGTTADAVVLGTVADNLASLGKYGIKKVYQVADAKLNTLDAQVFTQVIGEVIANTGSDTIVFSGNVTGKAVAPRLSARLKAGLVTGAVGLPDLSSGFTVKKTVFSGKAFAFVQLLTTIKIISINPNSYSTKEVGGTAETRQLSIPVPDSKLKVTATNKVSGSVPLSEAEIVVSGGRGLKGPENWGMVEELAGLLGAATACSRPVADSHWRPHHEHVGQTGLAIAPNLYIAIGISGAIQHLAGVNRSKVIVVINKDPEAPFFKAADYGIAGDAFEVVPKIIEAVKKLKGK